MNERTLRRLGRIATACFLLAAPAASAQTVGDPERGEAVFGICQPCHDVGAGARNKTGPQLNGMFGRQAGDVEGFHSSLPMVAAGLRGLVWDDDNLNAYLADPLAVVPASDKPYIAVFIPRDRADLIAYLRRATAPDDARPARQNPTSSD